MAASRTKAPPVGSSGWIQSEKEHASEITDQEVEEFGFSVRNEMEWLNEHMVDIFSKTEVNFADMFKTPGKLRGKTPRTARKVNNLAAPRQPLTDIFAPNLTPAPPTAVKTGFQDKIAQFQIAQDTEDQIPQRKPASRAASPQRAGKPCTDSGYHGMMTEDEMEVDALSQTQPWTQPASIDALSDVDEPQKVPLREDQPRPQRIRDGKADESGASDDSFVSAREQDSQQNVNVEAVDSEMVDIVPAGIAVFDTETNTNAVPPAAASIVKEEPTDEVKGSVTDQDHDAEMDMGTGTPQSDGSSPEKPFARKSSFTFSALPAREPLGTKKSMGQLDHHRSSVFGKSISKPHIDARDDEEEPMQGKATAARLHGKSSTQLLHERLNMLGKTKEPRSSKSIPQSVLNTQPLYPQLPESEPVDSQTTQPLGLSQRDAANAAPAVQDDDADWIAPTKPAQPEQINGGTITAEAASARPPIHQKSMSTTVMPSPYRPDMATDSRHQKAISVSHPNLVEVLESTTPAGSPARPNDGPLSASKNRLWSALKSAKNIFASSASASATAKLEAYNNSPSQKSPPKFDSGDNKVFNMPGALQSTKSLFQSPTRNGSVVSFSPSRKTRKSSESDKKKEKELKAQQKAAEELEKAREKERLKAAKQLAEERAKAEKIEKTEAARLKGEAKQLDMHSAVAPAERPESAGSSEVVENEMAPAPPAKNNIFPSGKLRAPGRPMRPTREPPQTKPAPVSIRVASQSQRAGPPAAGAYSKSHRESTAPAPPPKDVARPSSALGHRPGSAAPGNARVRALEAAARKKEADERAAQKKVEQKREMERKRAERAEQEKRAEEERKAAEYQRIQEAKLAIQRKAAERQAAEARKREQERQEQQQREQDRLDQQRREQERAEQQRRDAEQARQQEEARKGREAQDLAESIRRERAQQAQASRGDVPGTLRQLTKNIIPSNPAKPAKRQLPQEEEEPIQQPQRPGIVRGPHSYQQTEAKRRKTNEDQDEPNQRTSVMAPPKRPSTLRKETMSKFSGYTHAPPPAAHHSSMFKATVTTQHQMQHGSRPAHPSQLVHTSNARIPFAENANPPASHHAGVSQMHPGHENAQPNKFKTPARPAATAPKSAKSAKSTPHYPQGDNIELPEIATDSEDESDDEGPTGFRAPSWVASPALRDLLTQQQLVDPETVFGPIGELKMDEVFKNSKNQERLKRFRDRGSSALWTETGDAVTSAEKRKDMELRERVVREGGWRYEPNV